jgi:hypothetical protein
VKIRSSLLLWVQAKLLRAPPLPVQVRVQVRVQVLGVREQALRGQEQALQEQVQVQVQVQRLQTCNPQMRRDRPLLRQ